MIDRRLAVLLLAGTAGCMRIYPDPELPDVVVEWFNDCGDDGVTVRIDVVSPDGTQVSQDAACADGTDRVEDLERTTHTITASLLDANGVLLGRTMPSEVDLRKGHSRRSYMSDFVRDYSFYRVAWKFDGGDTCESLGATAMAIDFWTDELVTSGGGTCADGKLVYTPVIAPGTYTLQVLAVRPPDRTAVAASELRRDVVIPDRGAVVDLGTIALTRCTPICEIPPRPQPPGGD